MELVIPSVAISVLISVIIMWQLKSHLDDRLNNHRYHIEELYRLLQEARVIEAVPKVVKKVTKSELLPFEAHTLIVGRSKSGKSNLAMSQIMGLIDSGHRLFIVDTKDELGPLFGKKCEGVTDADGAQRMIRQVLDLAKNRRDIFKDTSAELQTPIRNLEEYTRKTGERMPLITVVLEELVVLTEIIGTDLITQLLVTGRSAGVYVMGLSQYLKADILPRQASVNFMTRVFLGPWDQISATVLFPGITKEDHTRLAAYTGPAGHGVIQDETGLFTPKQFPLVTTEQLEQYMRE